MRKHRKDIFARLFNDTKKQPKRLRKGVRHSLHSMLIRWAALLNSELWVVMVPLIFKSGIRGSVSFDAVGLELGKSMNL